MRLIATAVALLGLLALFEGVLLGMGWLFIKLLAGIDEALERLGWWD